MSVPDSVWEGGKGDVPALCAHSVLLTGRPPRASAWWGSGTMATGVSAGKEQTRLRRWPGQTTYLREQCMEDGSLVWRGQRPCPFLLGWRALGSTLGRRRLARASFHFRVRHVALGG